jgi:hypothetical protein
MPKIFKMEGNRHTGSMLYNEACSLLAMMMLNGKAVLEYPFQELRGLGENS